MLFRSRAYSLGEGSLDQVLVNRRLALEGQLMAQQEIRVNPNYNQAREFMDPRNLRLQAAFMF